MQVFDQTATAPLPVVVPAEGAPVSVSTGATVDLSGIGFEGIVVEIEPTGNLAALTINLPISPIDGAQVEIRNLTAYTVASLTLVLGGDDVWGGIFTSALTDGQYVGSFVGYDRVRLRFAAASASYWPN